jgi:hypothetical protein
MVDIDRSDHILTTVPVVVSTGISYPLADFSYELCRRQTWSSKSDFQASLKNIRCPQKCLAQLFPVLEYFSWVAVQ